MSRPHMTPDEAQSYLVAMEEQQVSMVAPWVVRNALHTIAAMTVQEDWRLVSTESNGGLYQKRRWTRLQSEWAKDA